MQKIYPYINIMTLYQSSRKGLHLGIFNTVNIKQGSKLYYGSAKFHEYRLDRALHGKELPLCPTEKNFFLTSHKYAIKYTEEKPKEYYFNRDDCMASYLHTNPKYIHIYKTSRDTVLFDFLDVENVEKLLFIDINSPFHYNKMHIPVTEHYPELLGIDNRNSYTDLINIMTERSYTWNKLKHSDILKSGFSLLVLATSYYSGILRRASFYSYDFILFELMRNYLKSYNIDGWCQDINELHDEYGFFNPSDCLTLPLTLNSSNLTVKPLSKTYNTLTLPSTCDSNLKRLYTEMNKYKNKINCHHRGKTIAYHSLWVARILFHWFGYSNHPWTGNIDSRFRSITLLAGFIHDIGKIGDGNYSIKDTLSHPRKGYKFLRDKSFVGIDLDNIISTCTSGIKEADVILSVVVAMHHYFGELLMRHETLSYIQIHNIKKNELPEGLVIPEELRAKPKEYKYMLFYHTVLRYLHDIPNGDLFINNKDNMLQLLEILIAVSVADTFGAYPVHEEDETGFLAMETDVNGENIEILRPYYSYLLYTNGLKEKTKLLEIVAREMS